MDVNAIWAPHALDATARILDALRTLRLLADSLVRPLPAGDGRRSARYVRDPAALRAAIETLARRERHFVVRLRRPRCASASRARLAAMPDGGA